MQRETPNMPPPGISSAVLPGWAGCRAFDVDGVRVGHVGDVLFDVHTRAPAWVSIILLHADEPWTLAPARGLRHHVGGVQLACTRHAVRSAPVAITPPGELARGHALALAAHYGVRCGAGPWSGAITPEPTHVREHAGRLA